ncbi:MAG TPA: AAA family ATPase [Dermatophilaceae bacterium]|nr:AAA family ATPase [Dermatophilaceae bacterium]
MGEDTGSAPIIVVTGTGSRVDTTLAAAALTVGLRDEGLEVTVTTPVRTGATGTNGLRRLSDLTGGTHVHERITLAADLPPRAAATVGGIVLPPVVVHAAEWARLVRRPELDVLLVDDPEGILTELDEDGSCLLDVADAAEGLDLRVGVVIACGVGRDDLRQAGLIAAVLRSRGVDILGCVIVDDDGAANDTAAANPIRDQLPDACSAPLIGHIPPEVRGWDPQTFQDRAGAWLPVA